jgi:hypothetical protein
VAIIRKVKSTHLEGATMGLDYLGGRGQHVGMKKMAVGAAALLALAGAWMQCSAQDDPPLSAAAGPEWSSANLDQMLGPIALYPDPLIGLILPASTVPSQIVLANRYVSQGGDPGQIAAQPWDPSVQGLAHYPTVLKWMDDNLAWTTQLGEAFSTEQSEVMDSIQRLRAKAQALGNLPSTPQENVEDDGGVIDIDPTDQNEIYVPDYQPDLIYYQPGVYCGFGIGFPIGIWLGYDWDWRRHHLISWGPGHLRPGNWWQLSPAARRQGITANNSNLWRPKTRAASVIMAGGNRGIQDRGFSSSYAAPRVAARPAEAPRVGVTVIGRAPEVSRPIQRSEPSESVFGGSQSAHEVRESSSRGQESRGSSSFGSSRSGGSSSRH